MRRLARTLRLPAFLVLTALYAPALQAQAECEDISGVWVVDLTFPGLEPQQVTVTLEQEACEVTGLVEGNNRTPISDGHVEGSSFTFVTNLVDQDLSFDWEGTVDGDDISGSLSAEAVGTVEFTGKRGSS